MAARLEVHDLAPDHSWTARPGHKILVLDRGAVLLEFPADWFVQPGPQQIDIRDRPTAKESTCVLAVSYLRLPAVDWSGLPLSDLLVTAVQGDGREYIGCGPTMQTRRDDLEFAWTEQRVVDEGQGREARCRMCLARGEGVQCYISFDFWPEDEARLNSVWETVLDSLRLNTPIEDPTRGKQIE